MKTQLKISEFSRLGHVPVKTLRYYDEIGLLRPAAVDPWTKYRYYDAVQLLRLRRIVMLKQMGLRLAEIGRILDDDLTTQQLLRLMRLRRADLQQELAQQQEQLSKLDYWLEQVEQEQKMSDYNVTIKQVAPILVASARDIIPSMDELSAGLGRLFEAAHAHASAHDAADEVCIALYHDVEWTGKDMDVSCSFILTKPIPASETVVVEELSAETMAFATHHGTYKLLPAAYDAVIQWVYANGYKIVGGGREVYVACGENADDPANITEIQFPIAKA